ncbi:DUF423 domain-containing protein [Pseudomonas fluvialis]|jgi:uncharacterized membrane protein YgdD (TMEM256/DUF423 family)|uniref:DUF423 domain-containing protein n=1 Tax=Pseudomonas fluvialis TaxID=1793966 RepID=UPI001B620766|nr:DUF423 domain-containing protein [Pseudomonas sp.]
MTRIVVVLAGLSGAASVLLGAFAAHGLRARLSEQHLAVFQTAVHYQQWHSLALLLVGLWLLRQPSLYLRLASAAWLLGMLLFSGSLYALVLWGWPVGLLTPLGGLCLVAGWLAVSLAAWRLPRG